MKVHVLLKKEELQEQRLAGKVVVVLDILFATSSIVTALAHGARAVVPALDRDACLAHAEDHPPGTYVLAGEWRTETLAGFLDPTPLALLAHGLAGRTLIYATTNGTVALTRSQGAEHVYAAGLLNAEATVRHLLRAHPEETVLLVCSGSVDNFNLEDFYGAGYLVSLIRSLAPHEPELTDAARAASLLHDRIDALECLRESRVGRMMVERRLESELAFAARKSTLELVARQEEGRVIRLKA